MAPDEDLAPHKQHSLEHCGEIIPAEDDQNMDWTLAQSWDSSHPRSPPEAAPGLGTQHKVNFGKSVQML